jgi:tetrahydromethanopterin S-methyltransferase subunit B
MSEFRLTVTPRTDQRGAAAPSSGSSIRSTEAALNSAVVRTPALQSLPGRQQAPALQSQVERTLAPALQSVPPRTPALQSVPNRAPALQSVPGRQAAA